jgi:anti-anti-sigma factor
MTEALAQVLLVDVPDASPTARIIGEVDASNAGWVAAQLTVAADASSTLNIDLTEVAYLDSQGMRVLQALADRHVRGSLHLTFLVDVPSIAHTLLVITGIDQTVPIRSPDIADEHDAGLADDRNSRTLG